MKKMDVTTTNLQRPADRPRTRYGKVRLRSLEDLDQRTSASRRANELVSALADDLGGTVTTAQRQLCLRAAMLAALLEDREAQWLSGGPIAAAEYGALVGALRRTLSALGLSGKPSRDLTEAAELIRIAEGIA